MSIEEQFEVVLGYWFGLWRSPLAWQAIGSPLWNPQASVWPRPGKQVSGMCRVPREVPR